MVGAARSMVRAVSKYSLLSISPPQSQFEWHNAVELQPITEERTGPLHRRSSRPYICMRRGYLGLRSGTVPTGEARPLSHWERHTRYRSTSPTRYASTWALRRSSEAVGAAGSTAYFPSASIESTFRSIAGE